MGENYCNYEIITLEYLFLYGLLNRLLCWNFLCKHIFSVKLFFCKGFFPMGCAKVFCNSKLHHGWWNFRQIDGISAFWRNFSVNSFKNLLSGTFLRKIHKLCYYVYLANNIKILLHDFWAGCNGFASSLGSHFIPRGFAPWDEITPSGCCKTIASRPKVVQ